MRTSRRIILALMLGATPVAAPGFAFDGAPVKPDATLPMGSQPDAAQAVTAQALKKAPPATATATAVAAPSLNSLQYAAEGGHPVSSSAAQWKLGQMLFAGDRLPRQAARGLMWLTLARDNAAPDESWIRESYNRAFAKASDDDRAVALEMLEHWVQGRKD